MEPFRFHLFVCTQQKPEGVTSCPASGSYAVLDAFHRELQSRARLDEVQVTTCGCMGLCDEGPVVVVYPEGTWYHRVQAADVPEILDAHLRMNKPLERLQWSDASAMHSMAVDHNNQYRAMMAARDQAGVLPDSLDQIIRSYWPSRCLLTALELDVFTAVADGATAEQIGAKLSASRRGIEMLLNALVSLKLLTKSGDQYFNTTETARYFSETSRDNHRNGLLHIANIWHTWSTLTDAVRRGTRVPTERSSRPEWTTNFIAAMQRNAKDRAQMLVQKLGTSGIRRILDLGGGSGIYSITFAKASPAIRCDILDLPEVVPLTNEYIRQAGVESQVAARAGDMLRDEYGSGYDLVMLNAICHMFSEDQNRELFGRIRRALAPKGLVAVQDFILDPDKTGPQHAALFSLNMLVGTESGASYSEPEYFSWMRDAGFPEVTRIKMPGPSDMIVGRVA
jgi:(2Fe-2S) ferredoxin/predicted O-methyltransferase YrrM